MGAGAGIGSRGRIPAVELRLPDVPRGAGRFPAIPSAHPVVDRREPRLPAMVPAQRLTRYPCPDRVSPRPAPLQRPPEWQGVPPPGRPAHRRRARPHARSATAPRRTWPRAPRHRGGARHALQRDVVASHARCLLPGQVAAGRPGGRHTAGRWAVVPGLRCAHDETGAFRLRQTERTSRRLPPDRRAQRPGTGVPAGCSGAHGSGARPAG